MNPQNRAKLQWENETVPFEVKLDNFFSMSEQTERVLVSQALQDDLVFAVLLAMIVRLIIATSVHPRVGLLPAALKYGFSDLHHFAIMFVMLYVLFALLGTLFLGSTRKEFVDFKTTCETQVSLMIGDLPEDWTTSYKLVVFVGIHFFVFFFFLLNFLLAIIVEAYSTRTPKVFYTVLYRALEMTHTHTHTHKHTHTHTHTQCERGKRLRKKEDTYGLSSRTSFYAITTFSGDGLWAGRLVTTC